MEGGGRRHRGRGRTSTSLVAALAATVEPRPESARGRTAATTSRASQRPALLRLLIAWLDRYRRAVVLILLLQVAATAAMLQLPSLNADIIDHGVARGDNARTLRVGGVMLLLALAQGACQVATTYLAGHVAMACGRDLRSAIVARLGTFSQREVSRFGVSSLTMRSTNDVQQVQLLALLVCTLAVFVPLLMVGATVMAFRQDPRLAWLIAAAVGILSVGVALVVSRLVPAFRALQERLDVVNRVIREQITGIRVVRAFVREPYERERFASANRELTRVAVTAGRWMSALFPLVLLVANAAAVGVIWFGGHRVENGSVEVGALTAFIAYLLLILIAVMMGTFLVTMMPRAAVSAGRIIEVLDTRSSMTRPAAPACDVDRRGYVDIECVDVALPGAERPLLRHVTLSARPGQTVAIIGSTGAGKSTLINVIPRLLDATAGVVRVDGVDVRRLDPEDLWSRVGLVPQRGLLFAGTIADNLRYGDPDASDAQLWRALEVAQAHAFVAALPEGLATEVAQRGATFSGGQRQRLAIARALVARPKILLLDDAFSALDPVTEQNLGRALDEMAARSAMTRVVVAQRVASVRDADLILVLEHGEVVGRGSHASLLGSCPIYREIAASQGAGEVVA